MRVTRTMRMMTIQIAKVDLAYPKAGF
jgi:hypothetical protein